MIIILFFYLLCLQSARLRILMQECMLPSAEFLKLAPAQRFQKVLALPKTDQRLVFQKDDYRYHEEEFLELFGQAKEKKLKLATYRTQPKQILVKGVVIFLHSFQLHAGTLAPIANRIAIEGFVGVAFDIQGHGKSQGQRGQLNKFQNIVDDTCEFTRKIIKLYPDVPLFFYGEGTGAACALNVCLYNFKEFKISGLIMASGVYKLTSANRLFKHLYDIAIKMLRFLPGKIDVYKLEYSHLARNLNAVQLLKEDPLNYTGYVHTQSILQICDMFESLPYELWSKMEPPPIVVIHGQANILSSSVDAYNFFNQIRTTDKQLWYYRDMGAIVTAHKECLQIQQKLTDWLNKHTNTQ